MNTTNHRFFQISYVGPTNSRGSRVKIKDLRHQKTKLIPYRYEFNNTLDMALSYLAEKGIDCSVSGEGKDSYLVGTTNFATQI